MKYLKLLILVVIAISLMHAVAVSDPDFREHTIHSLSGSFSQEIDRYQEVEITGPYAVEIEYSKRGDFSWQSPLHTSCKRVRSFLSDYEQCKVVTFVEDGQVLHLQPKDFIYNLTANTNSVTAKTEVLAGQSYVEDRKYTENGKDRVLIAIFIIAAWFSLLIILGD